ncbi:MAG: protein kinase, partial [Planctomycetota bacterium]|nr:protein kinase [Planctomycetota bacterium]
MDQIGRYKILSELGRGAMGVVYRARDTKIGREVAIKTIKLADQADGSETGRLRERLFREAQSAGRLSHPGIVTIYDVDEEAGLAYITMEYVEGETLQVMMDSGRAADPKFISDILRQTAS